MSSGGLTRELAKKILPHSAQEFYRTWRKLTKPDPYPGMITAAERSFYSRCAASMAAEAGCVVDLGCWMGATTTALAEGLSSAATPNDQNLIHAYDLFVWHPWMDVYGGSVFGVYEEGESFLPEARRRLSAYRNLIRLYKADLTETAWGRGPIKILLVDAMKSVKLVQAIARNFFPSLTANAALIQQDYKHYYTPWIHVLQHRLRTYCTFTYSVPQSGTVSFRVNKPIPCRDIEEAVRLDVLTDDELEAAIDYSLSLIGEDGKENVAAAHIMHYLHVDQPEKAVRVFARYAAQGMAGKEDMLIVEGLLPQQKGGKSSL
jgi:hypothetical protein